MPQIQQDWLNHKALQIIKGIGKTPTDNFSAEPDPVVINLMSGLITLDPDGWSPNIAVLEQGGVWVDSPITDGRQLLAAAVGNVTEKMTAIISDSSYLNTVKTLLGLNKMVSDCRNFWQTNAQIDPVYLMWWANCAPGPQYALISNIDITPTYMKADKPTIRIDMSLEREPYWRPIPPGANPKLWTFYVNGQQIGTNKVLADATLIQNSDHLITQAISNKTEWTPAALGLQNVYLSQNFVDIPASLVPGDAPALVQLTYQPTLAHGISYLYIGLSTRKQSGVNHAGLTKANSYILAAGDAEVSGGAAKTAGVVGTGELSNGSAVAYSFVRKALLAADSSYTQYIQWGDNILSTILQLDEHFYSGQFAVFLRAKGATDDTTQLARVTFTELNYVSQDANSLVFTDIPVKFDDATTVYYPSYVGTVTIPLGGREVVSLLGYGTQIRNADSNFQVTIELKNSSGAGRTVDILDLVLVPMEYFLTQISGIGQLYPIIDNTGYLAHGRPEPVAGIYTSPTNSVIISNTEMRGNAPYLIPNKDQRLHFFNTNILAAGHESSAPNEGGTIRLNIVPRWSGIRDV